MRSRVLVLFTICCLPSLPALAGTASVSEFPRLEPSPFTIQLDGPFAGGYYSNLLPNLAFNADGSYVAVWTRSPGNQSDVVARLFTARGRPRGPIIQVSSPSSPHVFNQSAQVAISPRGGFVVVWHSQDVEQTIWAQLFATGGARIGKQIQVNTSGQGGPLGTSAVGMDQTGAFAITWEGQLGDLYLRRFDRQGVAMGPALLVEPRVNIPAVAALAMQANGSLVLAWTIFNAESGQHIVGQRFDRSGATLGDQLQISTSPFRAGGRPVAAATPGGGFVVSWEACPTLPLAGPCEILARFYDGAANPRSGELAVSPQDGSGHHAPAVAANDHGDVLIAWHSCPLPAGDCDLGARSYDPEGEPSPDVATLTAGADLEDPAVAAGPRGFTVVYDTVNCSTPGCDTDLPTGVFGWRFDLAPAGH